MSFLADKKREHVASAETALSDKDYASAFFHTAKAAEFTLKLAEQSEGKIASRYADDAHELLDFATELKARSRNQPKSTKKRRVNESPDGEVPSTWELKEKPTAKLDDVAGLEEVKEVLRETVILPFQHPEVYQRFKAEAGAGVLMYGPPGNGKTFIARSIAGELDAAFFPVDASQVKDKYVGETEKNLKKLFDEARSHERSVIFLDEVDHLLAKRGNRKIGAVTQFLALSDGLVQSESCLLLLAATNKPWTLDEAVVRPGRLGTHVYVGPPDDEARSAILAYCLKEVPLAPDLSMEDIANKTDGYSGADMAEVCRRAKMSAIRRQLASDQEESILSTDFDDALRRVKPSVSASMLKQFEEWRDAGAKPVGAEDDD